MAAKQFTHKLTIPCPGPFSQDIEDNSDMGFFL